MGADGALIRLADVTFRRNHHAGEGRPGAPVLDGLTLELRPGERTGLTGHNGSGKTTLLHLLVGLLLPESGSVEIFGRERRREEDFREVRRRMGLLFQDPEDQLFCPTVADDVAFGPMNLGWDRARVREAVRDTLDRLGLRGFEERVTWRLSYGEKRLVSLAAVLAMQPEALLLDEPTAGLDADVTERLTRIVSELPIPMLVVSHDERFLSRVANRRLRLENGRLAEA